MSTVSSTKLTNRLEAPEKEHPAWGCFNPRNDVLELEKIFETNVKCATYIKADFHQKERRLVR